MKESLRKLRDKNLEQAKAACKAAVSKEHLVMSAVETLHTLEQTINHLARRCRDWYALYDPETNHNTQEHDECIELILNQKSRKSKMGADLSKVDQEPIKKLATQIENLYKERAALEEYIEQTMQQLAPNTTALIGSKIAAQLLVHAGSLRKLALLPASTIQVLGAEQAFFRFLQTGNKCPKHGVIIAHPLVATTKKQHRGKRARMLAAAVAKTAKVDYFKGDEYYGFQLREEIEKKLGGKK